MKKIIFVIIFFTSSNLFCQNIVRQVIGSTGNASSSGPYVLHSTVGQPPLAGTTMPQSSLTGYTYILRQDQQPLNFIISGYHRFQIMIILIRPYFLTQLEILQRLFQTKRCYHWS